MGSNLVEAPVALLLDRELTPPAKLLWLAFRAQSEPAPHTALAEMLGITRATVRKSEWLLRVSGWYWPSSGVLDPSPKGPRVTIPFGLLSEPAIRPWAKLLYGMLQMVPSFQGGSGEFTYKTLGAQARLSVPTVRRSIAELCGTGWIETEQANQVAPIKFTLRNPDRARGRAEVAEAWRRIKRTRNRAEAVMCEYLSLLIDSDEYTDNARPGFLVNPNSGERLELDRYYPGIAAFEYNGPQHDRTTKKFPKPEVVKAQKERDLIKEAICARRGLPLVIIRWEDLNLNIIREKIGNLLPLRDLKGREELIRFLDNYIK